jgi:hypothetical protein
MGGTGSKLSGIITRDILLKSTDPVRRLMDEALRIMIEQFTREDLRKLSQSSECSKYVIMIGDAFDQYFKSIDVVPVLKTTDNRKKTVFFQRADVLTGTATTGNRALDEKMRAERKQICASIAYFFTRIFQILSALSYSIFDDARIRPGTGAGPQQMYGILPAASRPFIGGPALLRGGRSDTAVLQGGRSDALANTMFKAFTNYVTYERTRDNGNLIYKMDNGIRLEVTPTFERTRATLTYKGINPPEDTIVLHIIMGSVGTQMLINEIDVVVQGSKYNIPAQKYYGKFAKMDFVLQAGSYTTKKYVYKDNKLKLLPQILGELFNYIKMNNTAIRSQVGPEHLPIFWDSKERDLKTDEIRNGAVGVAAAAAGPAIPANVAALSTRPVAHCIARSLQLLSMDIVGPMGGRKAWSFVCEPGFTSSGLPRTDQPIVESPGIKSLAALFTVFQEGIPKVMTKENREYLTLLEEMSRLYMPNEGVATTVEGIRNKYDASVCKGRRGATELSGPRLGVAQNGVQLLWKRQIDHAANVSAILGQMFIKDNKTGQLSIHPQLLTIGVIGLDIIAMKARNILTDYYKSCEDIYQSAVKNIYGVVEAAQPGLK